MKPDNPGLRHVIAAFGFSMQGLRAAVRHERAFRLELLALVVMLPLGVWLGANGIERALLVGTLLLVLVVELLNSALEAVVDRVGTDRHELSGRAKDLGSAAVFMAQMIVLLVWSLVLWDRFVAA